MEVQTEMIEIVPVQIKKTRIKKVKTEPEAVFEDDSNSHTENSVDIPPISDTGEVDTSYQSFAESIQIYESNPHYSCLMCMKDTTFGPRHDKSKEVFMVDVKKMSGRDNLKYKCVLPLGHTGKCCHKFNSLFKKNDITKKLEKSIDLSIFSTPGNDDYVYKNRNSRLYENVLSSKQEKKIRDKNEKKKCAIPLKDASTPILVAQAYLDWVTYIVSIRDIEEHLNIVEANQDIFTMISKNKDHLNSLFNKSNRSVFNIDGHSICVVKKNLIELSDVSDPTRDNRVNISDKDIQLGHNHPRTDECVSIRGENLLPMSRRGNLIIGERVFTEDVWIDELKQIVGPY